MLSLVKLAAWDMQQRQHSCRVCKRKKKKGEREKRRFTWQGKAERQGITNCAVTCYASTLGDCKRKCSRPAFTAFPSHRKVGNCMELPLRIAAGKVQTTSRRQSMFRRAPGVLPAPRSARRPSPDPPHGHLGSAPQQLRRPPRSAAPPPCATAEPMERRPGERALAAQRRARFKPPPLPPPRGSAASGAASRSGRRPGGAAERAGPIGRRRGRAGAGAGGLGAGAGLGWAGGRGGRHLGEGETEAAPPASGSEEGQGWARAAVPHTCGSATSATGGENGELRRGASSNRQVGDDTGRRELGKGRRVQCEPSSVRTAIHSERICYYFLLMPGETHNQNQRLDCLWRKHICDRQDLLLNTEHWALMSVGELALCSGLQVLSQKQHQAPGLTHPVHAVRLQFLFYKKTSVKDERSK